jgi:hypothetical protein
MKKLSANRIEVLVLLLSIAFILFWMGVLYVKINDFAGFKREMANQVFPRSIATALPYVLPAIWLAIAALLAFDKTRLTGMVLSLYLLLTFTIYVGLAVFKVYNRTPCDCAGLFDFKWEGQLL